MASAKKTSRRLADRSFVMGRSSDVAQRYLLNAQGFSCTYPDEAARQVSYSSDPSMCNDGGPLPGKHHSLCLGVAARLESAEVYAACQSRGVKDHFVAAYRAYSFVQQGYLMPEQIEHTQSDMNRCRQLIGNRGRRVKGVRVVPRQIIDAGCRAPCKVHGVEVFGSLLSASASPKG